MTITRVYPTDSVLYAMLDTEPEALIPLPAESEDPLGPEFVKTWWALARAVSGLAGCQVVQDGSLTFAVNAGYLRDGATLRTISEATAQALTNDATNYIYLTLAGALTKNTTGFPAAPCVPLAVIRTGTASAAGLTGYYDEESDVDDRRGEVFLQGPEFLALSAAAEAGDEIVVTIQGPPQNLLVDVWVAATDMAAPDATGNTVALDTGTAIQTITADAHYRVLSDATGLIEFGLTVSGAATRFLMASLHGRVESIELTFAA